MARVTKGTCSTANNTAKAFTSTKMVTRKSGSGKWDTKRAKARLSTLMDPGTKVNSRMDTDLELAPWCGRIHATGRKAIFTMTRNMATARRGIQTAMSTMAHSKTGWKKAKVSRYGRVKRSRRVSRRITKWRDKASCTGPRQNEGRKAKCTLTSDMASAHSRGRMGRANKGGSWKTHGMGLASSSRATGRYLKGSGCGIRNTAAHTSGSPTDA